MNSKQVAYLIIIGVALISFIPSIGAGFVFDFLGWQRAYEQGSFSDIFNSFGYKGNHQFLHFVFYSTYKLFYIHGVPWYLLFCGLHALNGILIYKLINTFAQFWKIQISHIITLGCVLLFIIHPYSVETVVWKACVHYLLSLMQVLLIFLLYFRYLNYPDKKYLVAAGSIYVLSLFSLEVSFITPLTITFTGILLYITGDNKKSIIKNSIIYISILWGLLALNLLFNKLTLGGIVGHYGTKVHLNFDFLAIASTEFKYLIKHLLYARFYSFETKNLLFDQLLSLQQISFLLVTIFISCLILYILKIKTIAPKWHLVAFGIIACLLFVLPVGNMFFYHLHIGVNDRYSYIPMAFICIATAGVVAGWNKKIGYSLIALLLLINIYFQQKTLTYWYKSTKVLHSLKDNFKWHDAPYVFVLNSPDNYRGIMMASIIAEPSGIDELIDFQTPKSFDGKMFDIFQFNMGSMEDGVKVEQTGPMQLKVTFSQWGNWWHQNSIGASTYENEYYKAEVLEYPYLLIFKQFPPGSVIIYQDSMQWKEFKLQSGF